jgi:4-amino-4-deoxy-L-arabinose transferase-like glycosyltransferase
MRESDGPLGATRASVLLVALLAVAALVLTYQLSEAWVGKHEGWNGAVYSNAARNHLLYGLSATKLGVVLNGDPSEPAEFIFYTNHPPLLPLALAAAHAVLGMNEGAARLVSVAFSLAALLLVYLIGAEARSRTFGLASAAIMTVMPMHAFYGRMVDHETLTLAFTLGAVYAYQRWRRAGASGWLATSLVALALGMASGWPAFYMAGILPAHHFIAARGTRRDRRVLLYPVLAIAAFALFLAHVQWMRPALGLRELISQFLLRTSAGTADFTEGGARVFTWPGFLQLWAVRAFRLFTLPVLALAAFELWDAARRPRDLAVGSRGIALALLAFGVIHLLLFRQGAWIHEYWGYYLIVPVAMLAAAGLLTIGGGRVAPRLGLLVAATILGAGIPRIVAMYGVTDEHVMTQARLIAAHARPREVVSTNESFLKPQVVYYARRDVIEVPLWSAAALEDSLRHRPSRGHAFFLLEGEPETAAMDAWLSARYEAEVDSSGPRRYRIFHIPALDSRGPAGL